MRRVKVLVGGAQKICSIILGFAGAGDYSALQMHEGSYVPLSQEGSLVGEKPNPRLET